MAPMISKEEIEKLANLCRLRVDPAQIEVKLGEVIDYVKLLEEVDTEGVPECLHVIEGMKMELRDDEPGEILATFLDNAPDRIGNLIRVPPVLT